MTDRTKGILAMIAVCVIWGTSPIFYHLLRHVPPAEVLAHRTLWSLLLFGLVMVLQGQFAGISLALRPPHLARVIVAAVMISINWGLFIWSVQNGHVVESSLGYYMFPLVAVAGGVVIFHEQLGPAGQLAVALATAAVVVLTWGLGATPWISLILAFTFGLYGLVKKALPLGPVQSVTAEVAILAPLAIGWLAAVHLGLLPHRTRPGAFWSDLPTTVLLILSGPITAIPLMLFARAARSVDMATVGLIGYLNPTLQFLCAVVLFGEAFTRWHGIAFAMIWTALAIYTLSAYAATPRRA
ncbi:EamA family transporter RarD [uncultured Paracoccus sp.]|uniref:EamA family transporter RarD n=1 Tax=uncultured Paracoccus sp. TaxID=189685 RepID=UPI00260FF11E|nr:EamA family transporter RarD [uncultured Paracoccus sp.]